MLSLSFFPKLVHAFKKEIVFAVLRQKGSLIFFIYDG